MSDIQVLNPRIPFVDLTAGKENKENEVPCYVAENEAPVNAAQPNSPQKWHLKTEMEQVSNVRSIPTM